MTLVNENLDLRAALALKSQTALARVVVMAVIAGLLWTFSNWTLAPVWWVAYAVLQGLLTWFGRQKHRHTMMLTVPEPSQPQKRPVRPQ